MIRLTKILALGAVIIGLAACSPIYRNHGFIPTDADLADLIVNVDTRGTVDDVIGTPSASGLLGGGDYYYVRSRFKTVGPKRPVEEERNIVAITFNENDTIKNIEQYDLAHGRNIRIQRRVTNSSVVGNGFWRQIAGNFGNLSPGDFFN